MAEADLKAWIRYEREKYRLISPIRFLCATNEQDAIWKFQKRLRITEYYFNTDKSVRFAVSMFRLQRQSIKTQLKIPVNTCGKGLRIVHLSSIIINNAADIGEDCTLYGNVAVIHSRGHNIGFPPSEIASPSVWEPFLWGVLLANGITVGAGAVVTKSFPEENCTVAGTPARKIN